MSTSPNQYHRKPHKHFYRWGIAASIMFASAATRSAAAYSLGLGKSAFVPSAGTSRVAAASRSASTTSGAFSRTPTMYADPGQAEVILVGCGAPNRGMGWYHAVQMLDKK